MSLYTLTSHQETACNKRQNLCAKYRIESVTDANTVHCCWRSSMPFMRFQTNWRLLIWAVISITYRVCFCMYPNVGICFVTFGLNLIEIGRDFSSSAMKWNNLPNNLGLLRIFPNHLISLSANANLRMCRIFLCDGGKWLSVLYFNIESYIYINSYGLKRFPSSQSLCFPSESASPAVPFE